MKPSISAQQWLQLLGQALALPAPLHFNDLGCVRLSIGQDTAMDVEYVADTDAIQFYCVLGGIPGPAAQADFFRQLLEGNLFGEKTAGGSLSIDASLQQVLLSLAVNVECTPAADFVPQLDRLLHAAQYWRQWVKNYTPDALCVSTSSTPLPSGAEHLRPDDLSPAMAMMLRA